MLKLAMLALCVGAVGVFGCSDSPLPLSDGGGSSADLATSSVKDAAAPVVDAAPSPGGGSCNVASDCRLLSYNCNNCTCLSIPTGNVDPVCNGTPVSCIQDPCNNKKAACTAGMCTVQ
jgi:hypothetical protein